MNSSTGSHKVHVYFINHRYAENTMYNCIYIHMCIMYIICEIYYLVSQSVKYKFTHILYFLKVELDVQICKTSCKMSGSENSLLAQQYYYSVRTSHHS